MCQCRATCRVKEDAVILDTNGSQVPFAKVFHQHSTRKSGKHHPDGMLWIRHPNRQHKVHFEKLPLEDVAPMILNLYGIGEKSKTESQPQHALA